MKIRLERLEDLEDNSLIGVYLFEPELGRDYYVRYEGGGRRYLALEDVEDSDMRPTFITTLGNLKELLTSLPEALNNLLDGNNRL